MASISNAKDLTPYWSPSVEEMSNKLWLPTKTVLQDLVSNLSSGLPIGTLQNSWFSKKLISAPTKNSHKIFSPSSTFSLVDSTDCVSTLRVSRKIRIYPDANQRAVLKRWMGTSRKIYNETIAFLKQPEIKANFMSLKGPILKLLPEWSKETPYAVRGDSVGEACEAVKMAKRKFSRTGQFQECRFRNRKSPIQGIPIPKSAITKGSIYTTILGLMRTSEKLEGTSDGRLILENGRWFYIESREVAAQRSENQRMQAVAIDPGVRTFATFYSPELVGKVGHQDIGKIYRLCKHLDNLMKEISKSKAKRKQRLKRAANRLRWKIKDLVKEMHTKFSVWLCTNFETIFLPTFETSQMVRKKDRVLSSKSVRQMLTWSHYKFKVFLKHIAKKYGSKVVDCNEAFTSKTCSKCGRIHNIGSSKTMSCSCGNNIDRDINGARGIFLRALRDTSCTFG